MDLGMFVHNRWTKDTDKVAPASGPIPRIAPPPTSRYCTGGLVPQFQRAEPTPATPAHIARGNLTRGRIRARVEHVFADQKRRLGLISSAPSASPAPNRDHTANLAYSMRRLASFDGRAAPA